MDNTTYLGDGAYAEFTGYSIIVYTSNGITRENEVHLERREMETLIAFARQKGLVPRPEVSLFVEKDVPIAPIDPGIQEHADIVSALRYQAGEKLREELEDEW